MHLILTHEQADFDALAASLGVWLLDRESVPLLPHRLNRNVRAYLTLYRDRLPFVEQADLPRSPVEHMTLVDTQSPVSIKGVTSKTQVHVVDHHKRLPDLDPTWSTRIDSVGACSTLLVESLREAGVDLDVVSATVLLLGIYEDTGSLSYAGTTTRDLAAATWLLDAGANLNVASEFLNHPLSNGQREVYERLLEDAEIHQVHGVSIVVASAHAGDMVDEISTLAHKLRDLFDPAGLFVLVALNGPIQMVARSTSNSVDVARVAEHFGGGGHDRAAAALIRGPELEQVKEELLEILPSMVIPPKTVGEIMSRGPQLLDPATTVGQAHQQMQRFGHEGYPIVESGRVVGLLTRRAVDRAMAHGMEERPASSIMDAGEVAVRPADSVERLQRVMIQHDWGQVPVVEENGEIIGIVTRTDLLKTLAGDLAGEVAPNLADRLEAALSPGRLSLLQHVAQQAEQTDVALYVVGGFVRDLLLDTPSVDFDLVVEGDAVELAGALVGAYGGRMSSHRRFGTAKWFVDFDDPRLHAVLDGGDRQTDDLPETLDFVSARAEFYPHPTALPTVERGSIKLDLHRRDFTINTMALRLDGRHYGQLLDHWGGGEDLRQGLIRVLHSLSFVDDPTRMLRAVRLAERLGFEIERRTSELLVDAIPLIDRVSGDRIRHELALIFKEPRMVMIMRRLADMDLLEAVEPALRWDGWLEDRWTSAAAFEAPAAWGLEAVPGTDALLFGLWLFRATPADIRRVSARLHLPGWMQRMAEEAQTIGRALAKVPSGAPPSRLVAILDGRQEASLVCVWLALEAGEEAREWIASYLETWRKIRQKADGRDLQALGLAPGPEYGEILDALRAGWLDGKISSAEEERSHLERLVGEANHRG